MNQTLYGRDPERKVLKECAEWLTSKDQDESIKCIVLYGPPGIGKTSLLGELYKYVYDKSENRRGSGIPYDRELSNSGRISFLSAALNPAISPNKDTEGAGFYWIAARFDDPTYRQYRAISLVDSVSTMKEAWHLEIEKNMDVAAGAVREIVLTAFELFSPVDWIPKTIDIGNRIYDLGKKTFKTELSEEENKRADGIAEAVLALNIELPMVIALDNAHWAYDDTGASEDLRTIEKLLDKLKKGASLSHAVSKLVLQQKITDLLSKGLRRNRLLLVVTIDSVEYAEQKYAELISSKKHMNNFPLKNILDGLNMPLKDIEIHPLNKEQGNALFQDTFKLLCSDEHSLPPVGVDDALVSARGLPLRINEIAGLAATGAPIDGPLESILIHSKRIREILKKEQNLTLTIVAAAILGMNNGRFSAQVFHYCMEDYFGNNVSQLSNDLERLQKLGLIDVVNAIDVVKNNSYEFCQKEFPKYIIDCCADIEKPSSSELERHIVNKLTESFAKQIDKWVWEDHPELPKITRGFLESTTLISEGERLSLCALVSDYYLKTYIPANITALQKSSSVEWAIWAICAAEVGASHFTLGRPDLTAKVWECHAGAMVDVIVRINNDPESYKFPRPLTSNFSKSIEPWQCGAWLTLLVLVNSAVDLREGDESSRSGERAVSNGRKYNRLDKFQLLVEVLADSGNSDEYFLEFVRHWLLTILATIDEFKDSGRGYSSKELLMPQDCSICSGSRITWGDQALEWLIQAQEGREELIRRHPKARSYSALLDDVTIITNEILKQKDDGLWGDEYSIYDAIVGANAKTSFEEIQKYMQNLSKSVCNCRN